MGYSYKGRLGCISKEECEKKIICSLPKEIKELEGIQITQLSVGNFHTLAISSKCKIYAWGENKNFVFGKLTEDDDRRAKSEILYSPIELPLNKKILVIIIK
jgi:alpha-tubulin suppressor-like RCC1 family protein